MAKGYLPAVARIKAHIGARPIADLNQVDPTNALEQIEAEASADTRQRCRLLMSQIFKYARAKGMGCEGRMSAHGWRHTARTLLHEHRQNHPVIEMQMAHHFQSSPPAVYNKSCRLEERRELMQYLADLLEELRLKAEEENNSEE